jgi:hypothetical protein
MCGGVSRDNVNIVGSNKEFLVGSKKLPANALEAITRNSVSYLFGNGYTKP